jgi:ATP-binding cassette subfamily B protein
LLFNTRNTIALNTGYPDQMNELKSRLNKLYKKINLKATLTLIWKISPGRTISSVSFLLLESLAFIGMVYSLKVLIDHLAKPVVKTDQYAIMNYVLLAGSAAILYVCVKGISTFLNETQAAKVNYHIDEQIHSHTIYLDFRYYENPEYLDILKRAKEAGVDRPNAVVLSLLDIAKNVATLASMGYILIAIDWKLLPLLALFVLPILIVRLKFSDRLYNFQRSNTGLEREAAYLSVLTTGDNAAKEMRAFMLGPYLVDKYRNIKKKLLQQQLAINKRRTVIELISTVMATAAFFAVTAYIIFGTLKGTTSVGDIAIFVVVFPQSFAIMQNMVAAISRLYQNNMYMSDIFELFNLKPGIEFTKNDSSEYNNTEKKDFNIDNVSFKYPHADESVLNNITLNIPAGKIIALVGLNGAGKSTLIKLLCRLYDPVNGTIKINGKDIRHIDIADYRRQVSVVFQDFVRYNMSAAENIWFGNIHKEINLDELKQAALNSGAADFIGHFPDLYQTMLGRVFDEGHEISIGQWQKLAIARAFYSNSALIIFDEATSALDAVSESELFRTIKQKMGNRSALVISHRLSAIKQADYIYVMADKKIVESGTHDTLINLNGKYAAIYKSE